MTVSNRPGGHFSGGGPPVRLDTILRAGVLVGQTCDGCGAAKLATIPGHPVFCLECKKIQGATAPERGTAMISNADQRVTEENERLQEQPPENGLELSLALQDFGALGQEVERRAADVTITDEETRLVAAHLLTSADGAVKSAEAKRVSMVKPLNDQVKRINDAFKNVMAPVERARQALGQKLATWTRQERERVEAEVRRQQAEQAEKERLAREAEAAARQLEEEAKAAAQKAQEAMGAATAADSYADFMERASAADAPVQTAQEAAAAHAAATQQAEAARAAAAAPQGPVPTAPARTVHTERGSVDVKQRWTWSVEKPADVPREYLAVDHGAVTAAVRAGVRAIAGIRIFPVDSVAVRR